MYLNKVLLYGNLTRDPELKNTDKGNLVASFGVATNRSFTQNGERKEQTEFHNLVAFGKTAEVIGQYMKKGKPIYVDGRLQTRSWEAEGQKKSRTEIIVDHFQFGPRQDGQETPSSEPLAKTFDKTPEEGKTYAPAITPGGEYPDDEINPEDIPF